MKKGSTKLLPASIVAGLICVAGPAHAAVWNGLGTDNEFSTGPNWDDSAVPASGSTQDINGAFTVERSVDSLAGRTFLRGGGTLNVTGGAHNDNNSSATNWNFVGSGSAATVNQSGGTYEIGHGLRIGSENASSDGTYSLTGGLLSIYRGSNSAIDASNPGGRPSMEVGGMTVGKGLFEISGGAMETRGGVHIGGTGTFSVVGSAATSIGIGTNQSQDGVWLQTAGGTLSAAIDVGGVTPILIDDKDGGTIFAQFDDGAVLNLSFASGVTPYNGTWTIMEVENTAIIDFGLALSATTLADPDWSFAIDNSGVNGLLTATYGVVVPEPSAMILFFGLTGFGLGMIRRRR